MPCLTMTLFDRIREACRQVTARASHVHVEDACVEPYAASLALESAGEPSLDPTRHYIGAPDETVAYVLTLDAINFGSGYFPHLRKRPGCSGYFTIASALKDRFDGGGPFSADELSRLTEWDCAELFGQDPDDGPRSELMGLYASALNEHGRYLLEHFGGHFVGLVEAAGGSAERLAGLLAEMPYFRDVELYDGLEVPFFKRAQLAAADLSLALGGKGLGQFSDLDRLTLFADNLVPHVLRRDGLLSYEPALGAGIDQEELVPAGSPEEVEIRASAVHVVELLVAALRKLGRQTTAAQLDYLLWNRGQQPYYKARPRHRTRTVSY